MTSFGLSDFAHTMPERLISPPIQMDTDLGTHVVDYLLSQLHTPGVSIERQRFSEEE